MQTLTKVVQTFPSVRLPSHSGGLAVEISLIAQLGHGSGNHLFASVSARQREHGQFVDELEEPSAKLGGTDFLRGDPTSLYSFVVGPKGHPFHRHAGHRVFTAISGSGGAQLRFSSASAAQIAQDPQNFLKALQYINIPPDSLFTVRFGGETWHQFAPLVEGSPHPVFFALSCHTNELGGALPEAVKAQVLAGEATIPSLTELLPQAILELLSSASFQYQKVPTTDLSLDAPPGSLQRAVCATTRGRIGTLRGAWGRWKSAGGFLSQNSRHKVVEHPLLPVDSLLRQEWAEGEVHHEDLFCLTLDAADVPGDKASAILAALLQGFLENPPTGVSRMMAFRNFLVRPMGLRTSTLGCPVSSLLSSDKTQLFANRYPVLKQTINGENTLAQVILGANDKHLSFRSCVGVEITAQRQIRLMLGTRVQCKNLFGRLYMALIHRVHLSYIAPTMLGFAAEHVVSQAVAQTPAYRLAESV